MIVTHEQPPESSHFVYHWRDAYTEEWTAFEVTSTIGKELIRDWLSSHADALEKSERFALVAWIPENIVTEIFVDGSKNEIPLLLTIPEGPRAPKATRKYSTNFKYDDIAELRELFRHHGQLVSQWIRSPTE